MRVLIILHKERRKGGAVLQVKKLASFMSKKGHEIFIISLDKYIKTRNPFRNILDVVHSLKQIFSTYNLDIVLTTDPFFTNLLALIVNKGKLPIVLRLGAVFDSFYAARVGERIFKRGHVFPLYNFLRILFYCFSIPILQKTNLIIFNSYFLQNMYPDFSNSIVIHNGVDYVREGITKKAENTIKLIYVGRIEPRKSLELIFDTLSILTDRNIKFSFSLIGRTDFQPMYWHKLSNKISEGKLWNKVVSLGEIENKRLPAILQEHDILIFSTDTRNFPITESLPNAILEGMANGLAIISTKVAGLPEVINFNNGIFVEPDPVEFADAINFLSRNLDQLHEMKLSNIKKARDHFKMNDITEKYIEAFVQAKNAKF